MTRPPKASGTCRRAAAVVSAAAALPIAYSAVSCIARVVPNPTLARPIVQLDLAAASITVPPPPPAGVAAASHRIASHCLPIAVGCGRRTPLLAGRTEYPSGPSGRSGGFRA